MALLSPLQRKVQLAWNSLPWNREEIVPEVLQHYINQLPDGVRVSWVREGNVIVGKVFFSSDENDFIMAQGVGAMEFVDMVNDAIFAACEIPDAYLSAVAELTKIQPPAQEMEKLWNESIMTGVIHAQKSELVVA